MQIELTEEQFQTLLFVTGYATGAAFRDGLPRLAYRYVQLINEINKDNPKFIPYAIPAEYGG